SWSDTKIRDPAAPVKGPFQVEQLGALLVPDSANINLLLAFSDHLLTQQLALVADEVLDFLAEFRQIADRALLSSHTVRHRRPKLLEPPVVKHPCVLPAQGKAPSRLGLGKRLDRVGHPQ